jgi:hypothetical protein
LKLPVGSPCVNAGTPDTTGLGLGDTDIAGNPRIVGSAIDLGAFEYNSLTLPVRLLSFSGDLYNGIADLQWQTDIETNFHHFDVEKSIDGSLPEDGGYRRQGCKQPYHTTYTKGRQRPVGVSQSCRQLYQN